MNFQDSTAAASNSKGYVCPSDRQLALRAKWVSAIDRRCAIPYGVRRRVINFECRQRRVMFY